MTGAAGPAPAADARGQAFAHDGLRGRAWGEVPPDLAARLAAWLAQRGGPAEERMSASAFRHGEWTVKSFGPASLFGLLRTSRAVRAARKHFACLPVPSPRPLVAVARGTRGPSLLVREFVRGSTLLELWGRDEAAERELPAFLAALRALPRQHGDLHPGNLLWTGARWVLLDVDGLRHRLHPRARVLVGQWASLARRLPDDARFERLFRTTLALARGTDTTRWEDVGAALARRGGRIVVSARSPLETHPHGPKESATDPSR